MLGLSSVAGVHHVHTTTSLDVVGGGLVEVDVVARGVGSIIGGPEFDQYYFI